MLRSIRWTLQLWHALLLLAVVCIFGATLYLRVRHARLREIDAELRGTAEVLAANLRPPRPPGPPRGGPFDEPPDFRPPRGGPGPWRPPPDADEASWPWPPPDMDGPPRPRTPPPTTQESARPRLRQPTTREALPRGKPGRRGPPPESDPAFFGELELSEPALRRFESTDDHAPYFVIWQPGGRVVKASSPGLNVPAPEERRAGSAPAPVFRQRGELREVIVPGAFRTQVLVGRSIRREQAELRQLMWLAGATGLAVTVIGLAGGWWLSQRAIRPIQAITATARSISASNLSRRISLAQTKSELGALAGVLNAMFARLQAAFERQVRFTADASHELRTPLSIIYSGAELALGRPRSADEYRRTIETCFRASKRMKSLVESLLTLARADAGRLEIKGESFDLKDSAEECVQLVSPLAAEKRVEIHTDLSPTPMRGDTFRIAQVITNLLTNAIHYNHEGGSVRVSVESEDSEVILTVADSGVGIAPEDQKHLFERFYRVDKARSRELGGSGLGLAICKSIVDAHGGAITFNSTLGQGSTVTVRLPRSSGEAVQP